MKVNMSVLRVYSGPVYISLRQ